MRAVPGGVPGRDDDDGYACLSGQISHALHDPPPYLLGHARVDRAAHATRFHRAEVFDVDDARPGGDGLVDRPSGGSTRQCIVEVGPACRDPADLISEEGVLGGQSMLLVAGSEPLVLIGLGTQSFALSA
ncbi:hypothetical protein ABT234_34305 [Streptomyces sp. NPDC001586]|uniref:hypothetical protein n=1 Tax=Streptomyces sp. NPDC001586 TaxID=3154387 RepID=UPI00332EC043